MPEFRSLAVSLLWGGLCLLVAPIASAAVFTVNSTLDAADINIGDGVCDSDPGAGVVCTLRAAINEANGSTAEDTINVPAGLYLLTVPPSGSNNGDGESGDLDIDRDTVIVGAGAGQTIVSGAGWSQGDVDRIFHFRTSTTDVSISGMTIEGARFDGTGGAAIHNAAGGTILLDDVVIRDVNAGGDGPIRHQGSSAGAAVNVMRITNSAIHSTYGSNTSAIQQSYGSGAARPLVLELENVTIASTSHGSLPNNRNGVIRVENGTASLSHVTLYRNRYGVDVAAGATANIQNSLFANNGDDETGRNCRTDIQPVDADGNASGVVVVGGTINSLGGNYSSDGTCVTFIGGGDVNAGGDPGLVDLRPASGTVVVPFFTGSEITVAAGCAVTDQVGTARPANCTIGAYEGTVAAPAILAAPATAPGVVSGVVFRDYNDNGQRDIGEPAVSGITVSAYGTAAAAVDTAVTSATGQYQLNVGGVPDVRVEFTGVPGYLVPGAFGADTGTTVQFVSAPSDNVNLGLLNPGQYCQSDPILATNCYLIGDQAAYLVEDTLVGFRSSYRSDSRSDGSVIGENGFGGSGNPTGPWAYTSPDPEHLATGSQIGSTWGMAYHRSSGDILVSAFHKRHAGQGPSGPGAIYRVDPTGAALPTTLLTLADVTTDPHATNAGDYTVDADAWDAVGRASLGDMDISDDDTTLFVANLEARTLDVVDIAAAIRTAQVAIPSALPGAAVGCLAADVMPFAVAHNDGVTYVGLTCTATSTQSDADLRGYVYAFNGAAFGASPVLEFDFAYARGNAFANDEYALPAIWRAWTPQGPGYAAQIPAAMFDQEVTTGNDNIRAAYAQPMLADIEFDDGDMVLAIMDRAGHQMANSQPLPDGRTFADASEGVNISELSVVEAAGDILRACAVGGSWQIESNGQCGGTTTAGVVNQEGPGGGEFYFEDQFLAGHPEVLMGGLEQVAGQSNVVYTAYDPVQWNRDFNSGGIHWASNDYGSWQGGYRLYDTRMGGDTFAKANGLGDIEALCELAPIEIGNFIWYDSDGDGLQDPGEPALGGVLVGLYDSVGNLIATVETTVDGQYLFSSDPNRADINQDVDGTPEFDYGIALLIHGTNYTVGVLDSNFDPGGALFGWTSTSSNATADFRDSDAVATAVGAGASAAALGVQVATAGIGENDHTFDFGFIAPRYDLALIKTLAPGQSAWILDGDVVNYRITVRNQGNVASNTFAVTDVIPYGMSYVNATGTGFSCVFSAGTPPAVPDEVLCTYSPPTAADLAPGSDVVINLQMRVDDLTQAPFQNWAEIENDSAALYGVTDDDSDPGDHNGADNGPGTGGGGSDPSIDHDDLSHTGDSGYDDATEDEDDSDPVTIQAASTTPVSLANVSSSYEGDVLTVVWTTTSEEANLGFRVYGKIDGSWTEITHDMLPSQVSGDSHIGARYLSSHEAIAVTDVVVADIDVHQNEIIHGPFRVGVAYGGAASQAAVAEWDNIDSPDAVSDYSSIEASSAVYAEVTGTGIHRVTFKELARRGFDWRGVSISDIAVSVDGRPVPRFVYGDSEFGPRSVIEFVVSDTPGSLYSRKANYRISLNPDLVEGISVVDASGLPAGGYARTGVGEVRVEDDRYYSRIAPGDDPWWMDRLLSLGKPVYKTWFIDVPDLGSAGAAELVVDLWGGNDNLDLANDHFIMLLVNGVRVAAKRFDGITREQVSGIVPARVLKRGRNEVRMMVRSKGRQFADLIHVDSVTLRYQKALTGNSQLDVKTPGAALDIRLSDARVGVVYRQTGPTISKLQVRQARAGSVARVLVNGSGEDDRVFVAGEKSLITPRLLGATRKYVFESEDVDYLVIAHPRFNTADLTRLTQAREAQGYRVKTVDVRTVYHAFGSGQATAFAIKEYIRQAQQAWGVRYVLLVGDDTYDYRTNLKRRSVSYIPSLYGDTGSHIRHAPVDALYGDVDEDGVPDVAVGRLPVSSPFELRAIVDKTLQYDRSTDSKLAVLAADSVDDASRHSFKADAERMITALGADWTVVQAFPDVIGAARSRNRILGTVSQGARLTGYIGHTSRGSWSFDGILGAGDIAKMNNIGSPTVVTQFGCWNSDYVTPFQKTLGERLLVTPNVGAAAVIGATSLTGIKSEARFAELLYDRLGNPGMSLGDAMIGAKRALVAERSTDKVRDILGAFIILGDPLVVPSVQQ